MTTNSALTQAQVNEGISAALPSSQVKNAYIHTIHVINQQGEQITNTFKNMAARIDDFANSTAAIETHTNTKLEETIKHTEEAAAMFQALVGALDERAASKT